MDFSTYAYSLKDFFAVIVFVSRFWSSEQCQKHLWQEYNK